MTNKENREKVDMLTPNDVATAVMMMEALGNKGVVVSVAFGQCGDKGIVWTAQACSLQGEEFNAPLMAETFQHAVAILVWECVKRKWVSPLALEDFALAVLDTLEG